MADCTRESRPRSYVRRGGRITKAQRQAVTTHWESLGLPPGEPLDLDRIFGRRAPHVLEIGFGMGEVLIDAAASTPAWDFLGIDVHEPGIGRVLAAAAAAALSNLRVLRGDAAELLPASFAARSLDQIWVLYPDPWPKKRHHKRRLVQPAFAAELVRALRPGGRLRLATDWEDYARHMLEVLDVVEGLRNVAGPGRYCPAPQRWAESKFERRGRRLGHPILHLSYTRA